MKEARNGFNAFGIALLINIFRNAESVTIEWYIVFLLIIVIPCGLITAPSEDASKTGLVLVIQFLLFAIYLLALPWLFWKGIDISRKQGCDLKVFFFGTVHLYDKVWRFMEKIFSILGAVVGVLIIVSLAIEIRKYARGTVGSWYLTHGGHTHYVRSIFLALSSGILAIVFVEKTITLNDIDMSAGPITAAGQLIPLIIGSYVLFVTVMSILKKGLRLLKKTPRRRTSSDRRNRATDVELAQNTETQTQESATKGYVRYLRKHFHIPSLRR
jgi:hypothetical protein